MKKVFLMGIMTLSAMYAGEAQLMKQAFPSAMFGGDCAGDNGKINFSIIKQLEGTALGQQLLDQKISKIQTCQKGNNPNFNTNLQLACNNAQSITSPTKDKICGTSAPSDASSSTGTQDITSYIKKAFPTSMFGACNAGNGAIDFNAVSVIEQMGGSAQIINNINSISKCLADTSNKNFISAVQQACKAQTPSSTTKTQICGWVGVSTQSSVAAPTVAPVMPQPETTQAVVGIPVATTPAAPAVDPTIIANLEQKIATLEAANTQNQQEIAGLKGVDDQFKHVLTEQVQPYMTQIYNIVTGVVTQ